MRREPGIQSTFWTGGREKSTGSLYFGGVAGDWQWQKCRSQTVFGGRQWC